MKRKHRKFIKRQTYNTHVEREICHPMGIAAAVQEIID